MRMRLPVLRYVTFGKLIALPTIDQSLQQCTSLFGVRLGGAVRYLQSQFRAWFDIKRLRINPDTSCHVNSGAG